ncbi:hypothetical protein FN846DRAFT_896737 [Sphaerosporella brunnea]|uniref:Uncharacterized protein n=1 Tax=Sphaerosporella brunnea TaxID=1250544 RepID=A0A5J5ECU1_9PEZI|nr:hypothetical protein FN846DRAFT_896737 [Sphaerosporella brunnea]
MSTSFEPRICTCSFAQFRHVVKTKAEWTRHLAKQRQDIIENITGDVVHPPAQPQYQYPQKGTAVPVGNQWYDMVEKQPQYLVEKQPRYLVEKQSQSQYLELPTLQVPCKRRNDRKREEPAKRCTVAPSKETDSLESVKDLEPLPDLTEGEYEAVMQELHNEYDAYLPELPESTLDLQPEAANNEEVEERYLEENGMFLEEEEEQEEDDLEDEDTNEVKDKGKGKGDSQDELEGEGNTCLSGQAAIGCEDEEDLFLSQQATTETDEFNYKKPCGRSLSAQEILSLSLSNIYAEFGIPRRCIQKINTVLRSVLPKELAPFDERTVTKYRAQRTGIKAVQYNCCINSCMSYAMYPDATQCTICSHPRWKETEDFRAPGRTHSSCKPFAQHTYVPVAHRIKLGWSDAKRADLMLRYRNMAGAAPRMDNARIFGLQI